MPCGFLGPNRLLLLVRMRRRSERSTTTATKVIAVMASGAEKLKTRIASWSRAAPMARTITAAAAQNSPRESILHPFVRFSPVHDSRLRTGRYGIVTGSWRHRPAGRELSHNANGPDFGSRHACRRDRGRAYRRW